MVAKQETVEREGVVALIQEQKEKERKEVVYLALGVRRVVVMED